MIVLYIIFGILAALIFLLSLPVNIRILYDYPTPKWWKRPPEEKPVDSENEYVPLTDDPELLAVVDYLKSNGLWSKPPQPPPEPELTVKMQVLFFRFTLYPKPAKEKKKQTEPEKKPDEKTKDESKEKTTEKETKLEDILALIKQVLPPIKRFGRTIGKNIRFHHIRLEAEVSAENSADTAKKFVRLNQALYGFLTVAQNYVEIRFSKIRITPDFYAEHNNFVGELRIGFNPIVILGALLRLGLSLLPLLFHKDKSEPAPKQNPSDTSTTDSQREGNVS